MRRSNNFVQIMGFVECTISSEHKIRIPIVQGILKHPTIELLRELLKKPAVAKKYTIESLRRAPWKVLKEFPYSWLKLSIEEANLKPERKKAILFMISDERGNMGDVVKKRKKTTLPACKADNSPGGCSPLRKKGSRMKKPATIGRACSTLRQSKLCNYIETNLVKRYWPKP